MPARRTRRRRKSLSIFSALIQIALLIFLGAVLGVVGGTFYSVSKLVPARFDTTAFRPLEVTRIVSSDGVVLAKVFHENREVVPIDEIPLDLQKATIAIEDKRFYQHYGVDLRGILRAIRSNILARKVTQGGSTITQQLARNIYLTRERKLSRKLQEIVLALQLERNYSKQEILELYLNQIYYGSGSYGVQTAARVYFGKHVKDLSLAECALIAGLPQKPSMYSPYENRQLAIARRNVVLDNMVQMGYITPKQAEQAKAEPVHLVGLKPSGISQYKAPWFVVYVIKELSNRYGEDFVYRGGLTVHTTLNYRIQQAAEEELREGVLEAKSKRVSQGALICLDPHTGAIRAMVGGVNPEFTKDQFNRAVQAKRQPGSAFKAFVYTAAVEAGYPPAYRISNRRVTYGSGPSSWSPRNYDGRYGGSYTMKQALARSVNICAVRMADKVGIDQVILYARMLGIKSPLSRNLALALGASEVSALEICSAYGVFATGGIRAEPMAILRIESSDGHGVSSVIEENEPITRQVLSEQTARIMDEMFRAVVTSRGGTGYAASRVPEARGKTGTTQNDRTAWFIGYTPELVVAVWVGNDDNSPMRHVWGGNVCASIWAAFMLRALPIHREEMAARGSAGDEHPVEFDSETDYRPRRHREPRDNQMPPPTTTERPEYVTVRLCSQSGLVATDACPNTYEVTYPAGSEPRSSCPIHTQPALSPRPSVPSSSPSSTVDQPASHGQYVTVRMCVESGRIANDYCPQTILRTFRWDERPSIVCTLHHPPRE